MERVQKLIDTVREWKETRPEEYRAAKLLAADIKNKKQNMKRDYSIYSVDKIESLIKGKKDYVRMLDEEINREITADRYFLSLLKKRNEAVTELEDMQRVLEEKKKNGCIIEIKLENVGRETLYWLYRTLNKYSAEVEGFSYATKTLS